MLNEIWCWSIVFPSLETVVVVVELTLDFPPYWTLTPLTADLWLPPSKGSMAACATGWRLNCTDPGCCPWRPRRSSLSLNTSTSTLHYCWWGDSYWLTVATPNCLFILRRTSRSRLSLITADLGQNVSNNGAVKQTKGQLFCYPHGNRTKTIDVIAQRMRSLTPRLTFITQ